MRVRLRPVLLWVVCICVGLVFFMSIHRIDFLCTKSLHVTRSYQRIWPEEGEGSDRIMAQMDFIPQSLDKSTKLFQRHGVKTIFLNKQPPEGQEGIAFFAERRCPVDSCELTTDISMINQSDCVMFQKSVSHKNYTRPKNQIWVLYMLESPYHIGWIVRENERDQVNWTATYRRDSTIVTPYGKFVLHDQSIRTMPQTKNYAEGKTKKVAWFVSNCNAINLRMEYATELQKYINVDIFGFCGDVQCKESNPKACFLELDKHYKFYLSFENANCRDYITEKFFVNGLQHNVIPIVMGAPPDDYEKVAPYHSYIHVEDFDSPVRLAEYLHKLDTDDKLFNEYFQWKGTGTFIDTIYWCRLCAMLHDETHGPSWYPDVKKWWKGEGQCPETDSWMEYRNQTLNGTWWANRNPDSQGGLIVRNKKPDYKKTATWKKHIITTLVSVVKV